MTKANVTNAEVAERIGLTPAGVSRLRTESAGPRRTPSYAVMKVIRDEYGWEIVDQMETAKFGKSGAYARVLEEYLEADRKRRAEDARRATRATVVDHNEDGTVRITEVFNVND